eukprot:6107739-Pleurochrysis_carterae.AAC.1
MMPSYVIVPIADPIRSPLSASSGTTPPVAHPRLVVRDRGAGPVPPASRPCQRSADSVRALRVRANGPC